MAVPTLDTEAPSVDELPLAVAVQAAVHHLEEVRREMADLDESLRVLEGRLSACRTLVDDGHPRWTDAIRVPPIDSPLTA